MAIFKIILEDIGSIIINYLVETSDLLFSWVSI